MCEIGEVVCTCQNNKTGRSALHNSKKDLIYMGCWIRSTFIENTCKNRFIAGTCAAQESLPSVESPLKEAAFKVMKIYCSNKNIYGSKEIFMVILYK